MPPAAAEEGIADDDEEALLPDIVVDVETVMGSAAWTVRRKQKYTKTSAKSVDDAAMAGVASAVVVGPPKVAFLASSFCQ